MELKTFLKSKGRHYRRALSDCLGISNFYLGQVALGRRRPSETLAIAIEHATGGEVTLADLRPDMAEQLSKAGYVLHPELRQAA